MSKAYFKSILIFLVFLLQSKLIYANEIDKIIKRHPELTFGIQVNNLQTGDLIYSYFPKRRLVPASTAKTFVAYAALEYLGADFTYKTQILFDKTKVENGTLDGDLYIKFSGDPSLRKEDFTKLVSQLRKYNINSINGSINIDDYAFDLNYKAIGESWEDSKFCFSAPSSAIVINKNCFFMVMFPAKSVGQPAKLTGSSVARINNHLVTEDNSTCAPHLKVYPDNSYDFTGCVNTKSKNVSLRIAYQDPRLMITNLFKKILKEQNIESKNSFLFNTTPPEYEVVLEHSSQPLKQLIETMLKNSDNLITSNILKTIGAKYYKTQGSFNNGAKAMMRILAPKTDINFNDNRIVDASGESRYNLIPPQDLSKLLISAYKNKKISSDFINALPIVAADGTVAHRLSKNKELHNKIRAKTGYLTGISNIAGYIEDKKAFVIMLNGYVGPREKVFKIVDEIIVAIEKL